MGKCIDLTGQKFGRLTVIEKTDKPQGIKRTGTYWKCVCECGNITVGNSSDLRKGDKISCGCFHNEIRKNKAKNLIGQKFGKLTVIGKSDKRDKSGYVQWHCECECGKTIIVNGGNLKRGNTKSCGCLFIESMSGEHNPLWKGGITNIVEYLRKAHEQWFIECKKQANYTCQLTNKTNTKLHTHHLKSFNIIVKEAHDLHNIQIKDIISDYTDKELQIIKDYVGKWHKDNSNAIVLCDEVHILFHKLYGKGNNTPEQYIEFKERYLAGEFKEILK